MPFTPFHMGAGLALKAVAGRHFSVLTFGIAQVAMDIEPLVGMLRGAAVLHGPTHTYLGAVPIALATAVLAPWLCRPLLKRWNQEVTHYRAPWLAEDERWKPRTVLLSALAGTWSHVLLDSVMHADITPWAPWTDANGLYAWIPLPTLHALCVAGMAGGAAAWMLGRWLGRKRTPSRPTWQPPAVVIQALRAAPDAQPMCKALRRPRGGPTNQRQSLLFKPLLQSSHTLHQPRGVLGGKAPAQPALGLGGKGIARGQAQASLGHQALGHGHGVVKPFESEKRVHAAMCRSHLHAGHGGQQGHQGVAAGFEMLHHAGRDLFAVGERRQRSALGEHAGARGC